MLLSRVYSKSKLRIMQEYYVLAIQYRTLPSEEIFGHRISEN